MAKKVLLCGEGVTDYGQAINGSLWEEGPVQPIIRKSSEVEIEFYYTTREEVREMRIQGRHKPKGNGIKAYKLCMIARDRGAIDHIVCYVDADRDEASHNTRLDAQKRVDKLYREIIAGFKEFSEERSQSSIAMIPLKMIESWLLADAKAFERCFHRFPSSPRLPRQPELIWGDKVDPASNHPKNYMQRVLCQYGVRANREIYKDIAENVDIDELRNKCPISFELFYVDIQRIIQ